ncbi:glycosyl hydrolase [Ohtaekwangia koreensis]|uniref:Glycosyl hydrolase family 26 n=1 Tax=Ohtaekwangia koreensis TaxID=688867 RepID=A0A1T5JUX2_9BACT|nr:glycosyl hydrolase [Ohtaekwangia koreensis]SKC55124.1 Glycosyl hydrolase family 26 [Ohtaekwangia koreensis]
MTWIDSFSTIDHLWSIVPLHSYLDATDNEICDDVIYAFSPDRSRMKLEDAQKSYLYAYPGDDYVDLLGLDDYMDVGVTWNRKSISEQQQDFVTVMRTLALVGVLHQQAGELNDTHDLWKFIATKRYLHM